MLRFSQGATPIQLVCVYVCGTVVLVLAVIVVVAAGGAGAALVMFVQLCVN